MNKDETKDNDKLYRPGKELAKYKEDLVKLQNEFSKKLKESVSMQGKWFSPSFIRAYAGSVAALVIVTAAVTFAKEFSFTFSLSLGIAAALIPLIIVVLHNNLKLQQKNADLAVTYLNMRNLQSYITSLQKQVQESK